ncbi:hypothetical protein [Actinophytocola sp.]|uniref:hypothetical protein n=1 Tax=Actinophytocola sp. TaxID=1872138 RepID=UPI002D7E3B84|nr:hypothetical protein [Actinophytocola sp.]HET9139422.1 hypothetical protein [Actinophytocola sp.]
MLLTNNNPRMSKRGLQWICDCIEAGRRADLGRDLRLGRLIAPLKRSDDVNVRRWLYKLIGLVRARPWSAWLSGQVAGGETDLENLTGAYGALSAIEGTVTAARRAGPGPLDPDSPAVRLAADYFLGAPPVDRRVISAALDDDPLTQKWLSLRHGADTDSVPREVLRDIAGTDHPGAVEYAIWAVHRDRFGRLADLPLNPAGIAGYPPNVRRWYIRLVVKDAENLVPYSDLIADAMADPEPAVREGLALGLIDVQFDPVLAGDVMAWFTTEREPLVRFALRRVLSAHHRRYPAMTGLLTRTGGDGGVSARRPARIFVRRHAPARVVPTAGRDLVDQVYILGTDTVGFSSRTDRQQLLIFRQLLDALRAEDLVLRQDPATVAILPRGDGAFLCFRQPQNRLAPLRVALRLRPHFPGLRFGVNSGPANWVALPGGGTEVISHAINWAARVTTAASGGQILLSDPYYRTIAAPSADDLPGASFRFVPGLTTKHGEPLPAWEAGVGKSHC